MERASSQRILLVPDERSASGIIWKPKYGPQFYVFQRFSMFMGLLTVAGGLTVWNKCNWVSILTVLAGLGQAIWGIWTSTEGYFCADCSESEASSSPENSASHQPNQRSPCPGWLFAQVVFFTILLISLVFGYYMPYPPWETWHVITSGVNLLFIAIGSGIVEYGMIVRNATLP